MGRKIINSFFAIILIGAVFYSGFWYGQNHRPSIEKIGGISNLEINKPADVDFTLFWDAWAKVQEKFVNRSKLDYQKMVYGAISGMLSALDDPYTVFMTPQEKKDFSQSMKGNFEGIGAEIGIRKNVLTILAPIVDSPAERAGLKAGDKILKINDKSSDGLSVDEAVSLIRGEKGTEVRLAIFREGWKETKDFKIVRDKIIVPIVKLETEKTSSGKEIAKITLSQFTENSAAEFKKAAQKILASKNLGIILDLRNNPGGYLDSAVEIAGWFLPEGKVVVTEDYGDDKKIIHYSDGINELSKYPLVILINEGSASASEILAGALKDHLGTKLVGQKSYGKGSVQELNQLGQGTAVKITVAKWLTPSGHSIMDAGLEADEKVELISEDIDNGRDPQLVKALEMLK